MRHWPWILLLFFTICGSVGIGMKVDLETGLATGVSALLLLGLTRVLWSPPKSNTTRASDNSSYWL